MVSLILEWSCVVICKFPQLELPVYGIKKLLCGSICYWYNLLIWQGKEVQDHLLKIQPEFKADLVSGVSQFVVDVNNFVTEYDEK